MSYGLPIAILLIAIGIGGIIWTLRRGRSSAPVKPATHVPANRKGRDVLLEYVHMWPRPAAMKAKRVDGTSTFFLCGEERTLDQVGPEMRRILLTSISLEQINPDNIEDRALAKPSLRIVLNDLANRMSVAMRTPNAIARITDEDESTLNLFRALFAAEPNFLMQELAEATRSSAPPPANGGPRRTDILALSLLGETPARFPRAPVRHKTGTMEQMPAIGSIAPPTASAKPQVSDSILEDMRHTNGVATTTSPATRRR